jgi:hypothetical protein
MSEQTQQVEADAVDQRAEETDERPVDDHLKDVDDGCGCTEIWEHLSDNREEESE